LRYSDRTNNLKGTAMAFKKLQNAFADLFPQFARIPMLKRVDDDLYQARVLLLNAQHNAEHWNAMEEMYLHRVDRLQSQLQSQTKAAQPAQAETDWREAYLNMRQWAEQNGLDTAAYPCSA